MFIIFWQATLHRDGIAVSVIGGNRRVGGIDGGEFVGLKQENEEDQHHGTKVKA